MIGLLALNKLIMLIYKDIKPIVSILNLHLILLHGKIIIKLLSFKYRCRFVNEFFKLPMNILLFSEIYRL